MVARPCHTSMFVTEIGRGVSYPSSLRRRPRHALNSRNCALCWQQRLVSSTPRRSARCPRPPSPRSPSAGSGLHRLLTRTQANSIFLHRVSGRRLNQTFFKSDDQVLKDLRETLERHGTWSEILIRQVGLPTSGTYQRRFGSITEAFNRIGFNSERTKRVESRRKHRAITDNLLDDIEVADPSIFVHNSRRSARPRLYFSDATVTTVYLCPSMLKKSGELRWKIVVDENGGIPLVLVVRLNQGNESIFDIHLVDGLPPIGQSWRSRHNRVEQANSSKLGTRRREHSSCNEGSNETDSSFFPK